MESPLVHHHVPAIDDRGDRGRVRRRSPDPMVFERADQARLGEPRWRLGEVLRRGHALDGGRVALRERRQLALLLVDRVVLTLGVHPGEPVEHRPGRARPQLVPAVREVHARRLELLLLHLARERALPDEAIEPDLVGLERACERVGIALERRRPDRLVRFLRVAGLRLEGPALRHRVGVAEPLLDDRARLAHRLAGQRDRVGSHVGDEADLALGGLEALVQPLRDGHRPLRREPELAAGLLLERGRRERRRRAALRTLDRDRADDRRWRAGDRLGRGPSPLASSPISGFSPSIRTRSAVKVAPDRVSRTASSVQYSRAVNARISRSRSTTIRTATDCTRPAERPGRTLRHSSGLSV